MRKVISLILLFVMTVMLVVQGPLVKAEAASEDRSFLKGLSGGEKIIAEAVYAGYLKKVPTLSEEVATFTRPKMEAISKVIQANLLANKAAFENVVYQQPDLSGMLTGLPPESVLSMIPAETKQLAIEKAQKEAAAQIKQTFAELPKKINADIAQSVDLVSTTMNDEVKEMIKTLIYEIGDVIDAAISESIESEVEGVVPAVLEQLPEDMQDLSPEEIAIKYQERIRPAAEAALRPALEAEMKAEISQLAKEIIEDPINALVNSQMATVDTDACDSLIKQIPAYLKEFVPEAFIKATVDTEIKALNAALPQMVEEAQKPMQAKIKKTIDDFIDAQTKLYINGKMSTIKTRILNNQSFLAWDNTLKAIGAKSTFNSKTKTITVIKGKTKVEFILGSRTIKVNGKTVKNALDNGEQPQLAGKLPVLPAEELAELFGYECSYNQEWGMTTIGIVSDK